MVMPPWYEVPPRRVRRVGAGLRQPHRRAGRPWARCDPLRDRNPHGHAGPSFVSTDAGAAVSAALEVDAGAGARRPRSTRCSSGAVRHRARPHHAWGRSTAARRSVADGGDGPRLPGRRASTSICPKWTGAVSLVAISHAQRRVRAEPAPGPRPSTTDIEVGPGRSRRTVGQGRCSGWAGSTRRRGPTWPSRPCRKADLPLVLAGKCNQRDEWRYLDEVVRPMLGPDVELVLNGDRHADQRAARRRPAASSCRSGGRSRSAW